MPFPVINLNKIFIAAAAALLLFTIGCKSKEDNFQEKYNRLVLDHQQKLDSACQTMESGDLIAGRELYAERIAFTSRTIYTSLHRPLLESISSCNIAANEKNRLYITIFDGLIGKNQAEVLDLNKYNRMDIGSNINLFRGVVTYLYENAGSLGLEKAADLQNQLEEYYTFIFSLYKKKELDKDKSYAINNKSMKFLTQKIKYFHFKPFERIIKNEIDPKIGKINMDEPKYSRKKIIVLKKRPKEEKYHFTFDLFERLPENMVAQTVQDVKSIIVIYPEEDKQVGTYISKKTGNTMKALQSSNTLVFYDCSLKKITGMKKIFGPKPEKETTHLWAHKAQEPLHQNINYIKEIPLK